eukprot:4460988-Pleurochrysis_carterae.AAC.1
MSAARVVDRRATHAGTIVTSPKKVADQRRNRYCLERALEMAIGAVDRQVWKEKAPEVLPIENACAD